MTRALIAAVFLLVAAMPAKAQDHTVSARSVLQINCFSPAGNTRATGFVWPEPGYMVTALHAVAGCENSLIMSEWADGQTTTIDRIVAVDLEPDLALVLLADDLGLPALTLRDGIPDITAPHFIWGYPLSTAEIGSDSVRFSGGLSGALTTLGRAYSSDELQRLYRTQDYPTRDTQILRVASLLQHGQSGAPILDAEGYVVAIADGGLLGGYRGMNWSIPAHIYLPDLRASEDEVPREASRQALLMSSIAVREQTTIQLGETAPEIDPLTESEPESVPAIVSGTFQRIGQLPLGELLDELDALYPKDFDWVVKELEGLVAEDAWDTFTFDVMEDPQTESWVIVPSRARVAVDPVSGTLEAESTDGSAVYAEIFFEAESFDAALREGLERMGAHIARLPGADSVPQDLLPEEGIDRLLEFADHEFIHETPDGQVVFEGRIQINGPVFSGRLVYTHSYPDDMSDADWIDYQMMLLAAYDLNGLEVLIDPYDWIDFPDTEEASFRPEPSALTLVRRVPLMGVAQDFVADRDFSWKIDLANLRSRLADSSDFSALRFDVYEDRATGATVAVPEGLELAWNPDLGAVEGITGSGRVHMAIAVHQGESFDDITGDNVFRFTETLSELAEWDDLTPADCELEINASDQRGDCWQIFHGTDRDTGERAVVSVALTADGNTFLGTSVYIVGERDDLASDEVVAYLMMLIGAEYLSDFAVF